MTETADLSPAMRQYLAAASVISEVAASRLDPNTPKGKAHVKASDMPPRGSTSTLGEEMYRKWSNAVSDGERARVERECGQMLSEAVRTTPPQVELLVPKSLAWKRHIAGQAEGARSGSDIKTIARLHSISRASVYNYLRLYGEREAA